MQSFEGFNYYPSFKDNTDLNDDEYFRRNIDNVVLPNKFKTSISILKPTIPNAPVFNDYFDENINKNGRKISNNNKSTEEEPSLFKKYVSFL